MKANRASVSLMSIHNNAARVIHVGMARLQRLHAQLAGGRCASRWEKVRFERTVDAVFEAKVKEIVAHISKGVSVEAGIARLPHGALYARHRYSDACGEEALHWCRVLVASSASVKSDELVLYRTLRVPTTIGPPRSLSRPSLDKYLGESSSYRPSASLAHCHCLIEHVVFPAEVQEHCLALASDGMCRLFVDGPPYPSAIRRTRSSLLTRC